MNIGELLLICISAVVAIAIIVWIVSRSRQNTPMSMPNQPSWERLAELDARLVRRDEVERLLQAGQKIAAIKLYREETGASLREAKDAVERIADGRSAGMSFSAQEAGVSAQDGQEQEEAGEGLTTEIQRLLRAKQKITAIKLYREKTGASLREAKDAVDRLEAEMRYL
jgi:ribosomal protein L7/L12